MTARSETTWQWLPGLLLVVVTAELTLNRLAVPGLRPPGDVEPNMWHQAIDGLGLFLFYFASALAVLTLGLIIVKQLARQDHPALARYSLAGAGSVLLAYSILATVSSPNERVSFIVQVAFAACIAIAVFGHLFNRGDLGVRIGLVILTIPLLVHAAGPIGFFIREDALYSGLPDSLENYGHWSLIFAAAAAPYCFGPRPFAQSASRPFPIAVGAAVGLLGAIVVRRYFEVGTLLASRGLGVELGAGIPPHKVALALLGLGAITWTIVSCLSAASPARRQVGVGISLIIASGYGFNWASQYLITTAGLLVIGGAAIVVSREERAGSLSTGFRPPSISEETWQAYVSSLVRALQALDGGADAAAVTAQLDPRVRRTTLTTNVHAVPTTIRVERIGGAIAAIDITLGQALPDDSPPAWTLQALPESGLGSHPLPPECEGSVVKTGDEHFDRRFRISDTASYTSILFDDALRARSLAVIDGWMAYWPGHGLRYRLFPGQGAPLDHPIQISELAFRGTEPPPSVDRLVTLLNVLAEISARGIDAA